MEKINRTEVPDWLKEKWQERGEKWQSKYASTKKSKDFQWYRNKNQGYDELVHELSEMTQYHCSFCDAYPMGSRIPHSIEHFKPKTKFPLLAYQWDNFFLCCGICQKKGDHFDEDLLKPDAENYDFDKYFDIKWDTGELIPNSDASEKDQRRAEITIRLYKLNEYGKPDDRIEELKK
ncbi:hypothetical protein QUF54_07295, partial [Candidatus Marithioploca araucensis]|nr:hypothetical protein [Candidatus Marithioploca araucensis]